MTESGQLLQELSPTFWEVGQQVYLKVLQSLEMKFSPNFSPVDFRTGSCGLDVASDTSLGDTSLGLSKYGLGFKSPASQGLNLSTQQKVFAGVGFPAFLSLMQLLFILVTVLYCGDISPMP